MSTSPAKMARAMAAFARTKGTDYERVLAAFEAVTEAGEYAMQRPAPSEAQAAAIAGLQGEMNAAFERSVAERPIEYDL